MIKLIDNSKQSHQIYPKIAEIFQKFNINPTPMNYVVFYHYYLGKNIELNNEIDQIIQNRNCFSDRLGVRLYEQYLEEGETETETKYDLAVREYAEQTNHKMEMLKNNTNINSEKINEIIEQVITKRLQKSLDLKEVGQSIIELNGLIKEETNNICNTVKSSNNHLKLLQKQLDEARAESLTDELTQIGNRKLFNRSIQQLVQEYKLRSQAFCLIFIDIDNFKGINDIHGHLIGDSVLRYFAEIAKQNSHENENICRYGGEEFAILVKNSSLQQAASRAEQIRINIASSHLTIKDSRQEIGAITASFGVAEFSHQDDHFEQLIHRADKCLYEAKKSGRNRVIDEKMLLDL